MTSLDLTGPALLERVAELIRDVHRDYFAAGANVATTASYQATPLGFSRRGLSEEAALDLVRLSVRLADEARREHRAGHPDAGPLRGEADGELPAVAELRVGHGLDLDRGEVGRLRPAGPHVAPEVRVRHGQG